MEKCVVLNQRPAGCEEGALYATVLRLKESDEPAELRDVYDVHLPEEALQVAFLEGYQLIRTLDNRLLYYGAPRNSTRSSFRVDEINLTCIHLLQVGSRAITVVQTVDRLKFQLKCFNANSFSGSFDGLEFLGVTMSRFCDLSGRTVVNGSQRSLYLAIAGKGFNVTGFAAYDGWGVLVVTVDDNNVLSNVTFRSMFTSYQTRLCLREQELLVWREGDLANMVRFKLNSLDKDLRELASADEQNIVCGPGPFGDRATNFVTEVNGKVIAVFQRLNLSQSGTFRAGVVCCRLNEQHRWSEICHMPDAKLLSICVTF